MVWKATERLSKEAHDRLEKELAKSNPKLINGLIDTDAIARIEHIKSLLNSGGISKTQYSRMLLGIMQGAGYEWAEG